MNQLYIRKYKRLLRKSLYLAILSLVIIVLCFIHNGWQAGVAAIMLSGASWMAGVCQERALNLLKRIDVNSKLNNITGSYAKNREKNIH